MPPNLPHECRFFNLSDFVNHSGGVIFLRQSENFLMRVAAVRENRPVKPEKVALTSGTKIAQPSSLADQRNQVSEQMSPAAHVLGKFE
jgi:hypothetical protein